MKETITGKVRAYDKASGRKVIVPQAFLAKGTPFPNLAPLPSASGKSAAPKNTGDTRPRSTTGRQTKAAAADKEK